MSTRDLATQPAVKPLNLKDHPFAKADADTLDAGQREQGKAPAAGVLVPFNSGATTLETSTLQNFLDEKHNLGHASLRSSLLERAENIMGGLQSLQYPSRRQAAIIKSQLPEYEETIKVMGHLPTPEIGLTERYKTEARFLTMLSQVRPFAPRSNTEVAFLDNKSEIKLFEACNASFASLPQNDPRTKELRDNLDVIGALMPRNTLLPTRGLGEDLELELLAIRSKMLAIMAEKGLVKDTAKSEPAANKRAA